jgi:hypothetical protein
MTASSTGTPKHQRPASLLMLSPTEELACQSSPPKKIRRGYSKREAARVGARARAWIVGNASSFNLTFLGFLPICSISNRCLNGKLSMEKWNEHKAEKSVGPDQFARFTWFVELVCFRDLQKRYVTTCTHYFGHIVNNTRNTRMYTRKTIFLI